MCRLLTLVIQLLKLVGKETDYNSQRMQGILYQTVCPLTTNFIDSVQTFWIEKEQWHGDIFFF